MKEEYHKWHSPNLNREVEMLVFGHGGYPVLLFPTSMGRYFQNKDFKLLEAARWFVEQGKVRIYCPDSVDEESWYNKAVAPAERVRRHQAYDRMIREELLPRARQEGNSPKVAVAGCSFGAFHSTNFAFRYPELVGYLFNMGGAYDIRSFLDGHIDDEAYYHNPPDFLPNLQHPDLHRMGIVLGVGEHDFCRPANEHLSGILWQKGIEHWLDIRPGATHDWPVWREMFPHYLSLIRN
ncbi:alpha/beta hydrolase-fold protein [soil metagenome]